MAKKTKQPSAFVTVTDRGYYVDKSAATQKGAEKAASNRINDRRYDNVAFVAVYQLVSIVRPEKIPVKIEKLACCKKVKETA